MISSTHLQLDDGTWKVRFKGDHVSIVDPQDRQRHSSIGHESTANHLAMALAKLPFESNKIIDRHLKYAAKHFTAMDKPDESDEKLEGMLEDEESAHDETLRKLEMRDDEIRTAHYMLDKMGVSRTACGGEGDAEVVLSLHGRIDSAKRWLDQLQGKITRLEGALHDEIGQEDLTNAKMQA